LKGDNNMDFKLTGTFDSSTNWINGTIGEYNFTAKHFDEVSDFGINGGRVSKLEVWKGKYNFNNVLFNYDRGWDQEPETDELKNVLAELLKHLESLPIRFNE
jgi:hypothetical protein